MPVGLEAESLYPGLTVWTILPFRLRALVPADVVVFIREKIQDLCENILQEGECCILARAESPFEHSPGHRNLHRVIVAAEPRISCDRCAHVPRKVNLRDDLYSQRRGMADNFADLVLGVVASVAHSVESGLVSLDHGAGAEGPDAGQAGILLDFYSPSLVVGEVPVEAVELVQRHDVQHPHHLLDREEVSGAVQMQAPVGKPRLVRNLHAGNQELL